MPYQATLEIAQALPNPNTDFKDARKTFFVVLRLSFLSPGQTA